MRMAIRLAYIIANIHKTDLRNEWRCLFNSQRDGKSFNTMLGKIGGTPKNLFEIFLPLVNCVMF